ncbi:hypothetical protein [Jiulongibacter sediminis]|uniref:hypothetical protein n=1 Tax=Jiulongibacter sediminis TaxID=1605367 RepID=UPI0026EC73E1|nr:hypothetical protein [Jiulongibacter sediminis]
MEKKLDQDHRLLAEKLESFEVTDFSKDEVWGDISAQVFQTKKKSVAWWWYAVAAMVLLCGTFFLLPKGQEEVANVIPVKVENSQESATTKNAPFEETIVAKSQANPQLEKEELSRSEPASIPVLASVIEKKTSKNKEHAESSERLLAAAAVTEIEGSKEMRVKNQSSAAEKRVEPVKEIEVLDKMEIEEVVEKQPLLASNSSVESMEGKKVVLIIDDLEEGRTNKKDNLFRKIGKFNRTGEWEKTDKEKGIWARFIESTKPDQKAIQL